MAPWQTLTRRNEMSEAEEHVSPSFRVSVCRPSAVQKAAQTLGMACPDAQGRRVCLLDSLQRVDFVVGVAHDVLE